MSGKNAARTAYQKIVDSHLVKTLSDGRLVLKLDRVWCHEITTPNAILDAEGRGIDEVFDPNRVKAMIDHVNPAKDTASAIQGLIMRGWTKKHNIELLDVGRNGVCHAIIPEKGWIKPGEIGIMGDSHTCTHGAFCAFTSGVGTTELEGGIITGLWICKPQGVIRVNFTGTLPANVYSKDLILTLINKIGVEGATGAVLEFGGPVIDRMNMEERMTITNMALEAGATSGMMAIDDKTVEYLYSDHNHLCVENGTFLSQSQLVTHLANLYNSDSCATYDQMVNIDVTGMVPVITNNYSPGDVIPVSKLAGEPVNQVYIGSCTNGRLEDLWIAASIFRISGRKVAANVRCIVVPATQHIWELALQEGLLETFAKAGCFISGPTCGACLGMSCGVIAPGEVCVSTTNRNFVGRMGKGGMVHLASPATAAMTAIRGCVSEAGLEICTSVKTKMTFMAKKVLTAFTDWKHVSSKRPDYKELLSHFGVGKVEDFSGEVFYLPVCDVNTDQIIPAKYLTETSKQAFGQHCLEDAPISAEDRPKIYWSQILVASANFGCGSSREHAPWALEVAGIRCVIAPSFSRIFENNMFANGLLCITLQLEIVSELFAERPESIDINWEDCTLSWEGDELERSYDFKLSAYQKDLIRSGGGVGVMVKLAAELQGAGLLE